MDSNVSLLGHSVSADGAAPACIRGALERGGDTPKDAVMLMSGALAAAAGRALGAAIPSASVYVPQPAVKPPCGVLQSAQSPSVGASKSTSVLVSGSSGAVLDRVGPLRRLCDPYMLLAGNKKEHSTAVRALALLSVLPVQTYPGVRL